MKHLTFIKNVESVTLRTGEQIMLDMPNRLYSPSEESNFWRVDFNLHPESKAFQNCVIITPEGTVIQGTLDEKQAMLDGGEPEYEEKDY